jgi:hypothetical protein
MSGMKIITGLCLAASLLSIVCFKVLNSWFYPILFATMAVMTYFMPDDDELYDEEEPIKNGR